MTTFAPPLDTGGGAFFRIRVGITRRGAERTGRATDWERRDEKRDGTAGRVTEREVGRAEHVFDTSVA